MYIRAKHSSASHAQAKQIQGESLQWNMNRGEWRRYPPEIHLFRCNQPRRTETFTMVAWPIKFVEGSKTAKNFKLIQNYRSWMARRARLTCSWFLDVHNTEQFESQTESETVEEKNEDRESESTVSVKDAAWERKSIERFRKKYGSERKCGRRGLGL